MQTPGKAENNCRKIVRKQIIFTVFNDNVGADGNVGSYATSAANLRRRVDENVANDARSVVELLGMSLLEGRQVQAHA